MVTEYLEFVKWNEELQVYQFRRVSWFAWATTRYGWSKRLILDIDDEARAIMKKSKL